MGKSNLRSRVELDTLKTMDDAHAPTFWTFAVPAILGSTAGLITGRIARSIYKDKSSRTQEMAEIFARSGTFWLVAGAAWIHLNHRNGALT
jgi:hypothetical protein